MATTDMQGSELNEYLRIIRARKWWIVVVLTAVLAAAFLYTRSLTPTYVSTSSVLVGTGSGAPVPFGAAGPTGTTTPVNMETEQSVAASAKVAQNAVRIVGDGSDPAVALENLTVTAKPGAEVLEFEYAASSPETAEAWADAFARGYLNVRRSQRLEYLLEAEQALTEQIEGTTDRLTASALEQTLAELRASRALAARPGEVVKPANLPTAPSSPSYPKNLALALLVGLALGLVAAFVRERLDDRLRDKATIESHMGAPVLAVIPRWKRRLKKSGGDIVTLTDPSSPAADAFRALRAGVIYLEADLKPGVARMKVLMVTSPGPKEGKSTLAANLGVALAKAKKEVICVDADLRRPRLGSLLGSETKLGLANVLAGEVDVGQVLVKTRVPGLRFIDTGTHAANALELLESPAMAGAIEELNQLADFVLIDTPPVLASPDTITLAPLVDGVLVVGASKQTKLRALRETVKQLETLGATIVGGILNLHKPTGAPETGTYYQYVRRTSSQG